MQRHISQARSCISSAGEGIKRKRFNKGKKKVTPPVKRGASLKAADLVAGASQIEPEGANLPGYLRGLGVWSRFYTRKKKKQSLHFGSGGRV